MDLSTVDGLEAARTVVQANDIIYVDSNLDRKGGAGDVPIGPNDHHDRFVFDLRVLSNQN